MIDLAGNLGVPVDTTMISYAGGRLVEHKTERLMHYIRNSIDVSSLFEGRHLRVQEVDDDELLARLVGIGPKDGRTSTAAVMVIRKPAGKYGKICALGCDIPNFDGSGCPFSLDADF